MSRCTWLVACLSIVAVSGGGKVSRCDEPTLPRYRLEVGQQLNYEGLYEFAYDKYPDAAHGDRIATTVWVVDRNDDGSWRMVLQQQTTSFSRRKGKTTDQDPSTAIVSFDLFDDGRIATDQETADACHRWNLRLVEYFPRLPKDSEAAREGWTSEDPRLNRSYRFEQAPDADNEPDQWTVRFVAEDPMDPIVLASQQGAVVIDRERRVPTRTKSVYTQRYGHLGKGIQTIRLSSVESLSDDEAAQLREDARRLSEARQAFFEAFERVRNATSRAEAELLHAEGIAALSAGRETIQTTALREDLDSLLAKRLHYRESLLERAERCGELIGSAAPPWELRDLEGQSHTLQQQRGKVVVLDFWYRACGPCMWAMPQVKQIAERPVAVFGMSNDREPEDARFVAKALSLNFPTLLIAETDLFQSYGHFAFPTLIVVDQEGVIRHIHIGYAPDIAKRTSEIVDALLEEN